MNTPRAVPRASPGAAAAAPAWRTVLGVFKLRIGVLIMLTALAGIAATPNGTLAAWQVVLVACAVLVSSAAAGAFNQLVEADSDRRMARTRTRAFASGALRPGPRWHGLIAALLAVAVAATWAATNGLAALFLAAGALTYAVVYTLLLKRRTSWNIVIGGAAGSFAVLTGAAAADPSLSPQALALALTLLLWTPPHFWSLAIACHDDYAAAGIPMLPVVVGIPRAARIVHGHACAMVAASMLPLLPWTGGSAGAAYAIGAIAGGAWLLLRTQALALEPKRPRAMAAFFASMVQLSLLIVGVAVDAALR
ncbi:heme o synthase [Aquabacterium humicola]|uniref:heme o synthase n=1 Tax=Aquabacterium humicola TaxID=3237377 RepID=UPI002543C048|nr:heme o synthase [Rubrivivax pictus]